jgi:hypothetical protein
LSIDLKVETPLTQLSLPLCPGSLTGEPPRIAQPPCSLVASGFRDSEQLPGASSELVQKLFPIDVTESFVYRHLLYLFVSEGKKLPRLCAEIENFFSVLIGKFWGPKAKKSIGDLGVAVYSPA